MAPSRTTLWRRRKARLAALEREFAIAGAIQTSNCMGLFSEARSDLAEYFGVNHPLHEGSTGPITFNNFNNFKP